MQNQMFTDDWQALNEQWQQRSKQMFQRCLKESDMALAQKAWNTACHSEKKRLEWRCLCLGQKEQEELLRVFATANDECPFFTLDGSQFND